MITLLVEPMSGSWTGNLFWTYYGAWSHSLSTYGDNGSSQSCIDDSRFSEKSKMGVLE